MKGIKGRILCAVTGAGAAAEDDNDSGTALCSRLSSVFCEFGYEVIAARSAGEALELALSENFVLYVIDPAVDDGAGPALCSNLRIYDPLVPVILYSEAVGEAEQEARIGTGALALVIKPNFDHLLLAILHALPREPRPECADGETALPPF